MDISDVVSILTQLFGVSLSSRIESCPDRADVNDDGQVTVSDAVFLIDYLFLAPELRIPAPYPQCGSDPTYDVMRCESLGDCE